MKPALLKLSVLIMTRSAVLNSFASARQSRAQCCGLCEKEFQRPCANIYTDKCGLKKSSRPRA